jgi:hypothetical protein
MAEHLDSHADRSRVLRDSRSYERLRQLQATSGFDRLKIDMRAIVALFLSLTLLTARAAASQNKDARSGSEQSRAPVINIAADIPDTLALELVKPAYPGEWRVTGIAVVKVKIDRSGHVVSVRATSGHPMLKSFAVDAARTSKFRRNSAGGRKYATGTITYTLSFTNRSYDDLSSLIGQQVTLSGEFSLRGKVGPFVLIDGRPVYLVAKGSFGWGRPYSKMEGRRVTVTGKLKFYRSPVESVPRDSVTAGIPEYFYFEAERAVVRLE